MYKAKKRYGQNFIKDINLLKMIAAKAKIAGARVIEVGPGLGGLTSVLADSAKDVVAYEIDKDFKEHLDILEAKYDNLRIVYQDFLEIDFSGENSRDIALIGNIPYYITTPIIFVFLSNKCFSKSILMMQKELGDRLNARPCSKEYNALSVICQYLTEIEIIGHVKRTLFYPVPRVDSIIIKMTKKSVDEEFYEKFEVFVKASFVQKRKTLLNNISNILSLGKEEILERLEEMGYNQNTRAEEITVAGFIALTRKFYEN